MGRLGNMCKRLAIRAIELVVAFLVIVYIPGIPPKGSFTSISVVPAKPLEGVLSLNNVLGNPEHIYSGKLKGPECFAEWNGELYTSLHGGEISRLTADGQVIPVAKVGQPCDGFWQEKKCGRPLGFEFDKSGMLYLADAYYGIYKVNIATGQKQQLVSPDVEIEGRKPMVFNSLAVAGNGDIYWTDSSSDTELQDGVFGMLIDGSGRLFHYDAAKKTNSVLLDGLWFANGVVVSPNEDFVVVAETARGLLRRYYLKGPKKGTDDIFVDGLPGLPDNLKAMPTSILVPLVVPRDDTHPVVFQSLAPHPLLRKLLARLLALIEMPFAAAQRILPHYVFERATHMIGHFESVQALVPKRVTILRMDWSGNILESWHNLDGTISGISEAHVFKNQLYLGSPYNSYIARTSIPGSPIRSVKMEAPRTQEAPKPKIVEVPKPKPVEAPKPKPTEAPKPKPTEAPKPKPTEAPKPKPTEAPKPKPTEAPKPKPVETPKPTEAPKPKPTEAPKPKPTEAPKPKPVETPKPKPTEAPKPKPTQPPPAEKAKPKEAPKRKEPVTPQPAEAKTTSIPVVEDIQSDSSPPKKDNLKIIRKEGPTEMPLPKSKKAQAQPAPKPAAGKNEL